MTRGELADAVNAALFELFPEHKAIGAFAVDDRWIGNLERGVHHWANEKRRAALRLVLGVKTDAEIGLYPQRQKIHDLPLLVDETAANGSEASSLHGESARMNLDAAGLADVVQTWTGVEAAALRAAQRMSVRAYAEHLGVATASVSNWERKGRAVQLRTETEQILDTDLQRASEQVRKRFFAALANRPEPHELRLTVGASDRLAPSTGAKLTDMEITDQASTAEELAPVNGLFRSKLKRLREERGHSLRQLSRLVHYSPSYLGHLEKGTRNPTPDVAAALDTVLKASGKLAALVPNSHTLHVRSMKDGDIFLSAMHSFRVADRQVGGGYLYDTVIRYIRTEVAPKLFDVQPGSDGEFAFRAAATLTEMSGWMAHDAGRDIFAERHFKRSLDFVMASKDRQLAAHVFTSMSHLANHMGKPGDGISFAGRGQELLSGGPRQPELEARILSVQARGYAALGDRAECVQLLTRAEQAISSKPDVERSQWVSPFDAGSLASEAAKCFYALGDTVEARRQAERIIELRPDGRTRSRAFGQLMLATLLVAQDRPDEACAIAAEVVSATQQLGSYLVIDQLRGLKNQLHACRDSETVAEFLACLDETLRQRSWLYKWSVSQEEEATNGYDSKW